MKKWTDQPPTDSDKVLDFILAFADTFLTRHASLLAKVLPPLFGFGIFLAYFSRHHFFPSFDLFQFSSLLLAAGCVGFATVGVFVAALFLPGAWIFHEFLNTPAIKEDIAYALPYKGERRFRKVSLLIAVTLFAPYLLLGSSLIGAVYVDVSLIAWMPFLASIPMVLACGLVAQQLFELRAYSFLRYAWAAYLPVVVVAYLIFGMWIKAWPVVEHWPSFWRWAALLFMPPVIAFIAALCGMLFVAGWRAALLFATFFALLFAGYSGAITTLPDTVVNTLGLGNYEAKTIALDPSYCPAKPNGALPLSPTCTLENVKVVWSFGEALTLKLADGTTAWIPTSAVRTLIRP